MSQILIRPQELRQTSDQLRASAKKIDAALQAIDQEILSLKGDNFLGNRANAVQAHYAPKRQALLKAKSMIAHFAEDLLSAATRFEQADKGDSGQPGGSGNSPAHQPAPAPPSNPSTNKMPRISDIALNQWDKRWANIKMNNATGETLRKYGCLMTVISMIARANGKDVTPVDVDKWIEKHGGYPAGGSYMSGSAQTGFLNDVLGKNGKMSTIYTENSTQHGLPNVRKSLESGTPVILHIDSSINPKDGHFVLAVGMDSKGNYICADPNGGKQVTISASNIRDARVYK